MSEPNESLAKYSPTEASIAKFKEDYGPLTADTPEGYRAVANAIGVVRSHRTGIEKRRVELKAGLLETGRAIDGEAKRLTGLLLEVEEPLKAAKQAVDDAKEAAARAIVEAEEARKKAEEEGFRQAREAELKAIRDAEEARIKAQAAELALERRKLEEERKQQAAFLAEQTRAAREADDKRRDEERAQRIQERKLFEEEQAKLRAQQIEMDRRAELLAQAEAARERERREEERRQADIAAARLQAEREEVARQQAALEARERAESRVAFEKEEAAKAELARLAAAKVIKDAQPDVERLRVYGSEIATLAQCGPEIKSEACQHQLGLARGALASIAGDLLNWCAAVRVADPAYVPTVEAKDAIEVAEQKIRIFQPEEFPPGKVVSRRKRP